MKPVDNSKKYLLQEISSKLEHLIEDQNVKINDHIKVLKDKICNMEETIFHVAQKTKTLENSVRWNGNFIHKKEEMASQKPFGLHSYIEDTCASISLPGLRYLCSDQGRSRAHGVVWITIQVAALLVSATFIENAYYRWKSSPVVKSVKNSLTNVEEIPFPTVTICEHVSLKEEYNQWEILTRCLSLENKTTWLCDTQELDKFLVSHQVHPITFFHLSEFDRVMYQDRITELLVETTQTIDLEGFRRNLELITEDYSRWNCSSEKNTSVCDGSFSPVILIPQEVELLGNPMRYLHKCQSFNGAKYGVYYKVNEKTITNKNPKKLCVFNPENILNLPCIKSYDLLYTSESVQFSTVRVDKTFSVIVHNPTDHPNLINMKLFGIQRNKLSLVNISPQIVTATDDLSDVEISRRGCVFSHEKSLSMFQFYTYQNCHMECHITCALHICGCVPFPSQVVNSSVRVCLRKCQVHDCACDCPPTCVSLTYDVDVEVDKSHLASIKIEYKSLEFPTTFRYSVTSPAEFVAYSLGILGVFNGFSVMLVWEVLYWLTLRLWSSVKRNLKHHNPSSHSSGIVLKHNP